MPMQSSTVCWFLMTLIWSTHSVGLTPQATITGVYPKEGSTFGGTYLTIHGTGFLFPSEMNPWDQQSVFVGTIPCKILPHYSNATAIACITGSNNYQESAVLDVSVQIFSGIGGAQMTVKNNQFQYRNDNTPRVHWARRWAGTGGDVLTFAGVMEPTVNSAEQITINIGEAHCQTDQDTYPIDQRQSNIKMVQCTLPDGDMLTPGFYTISLRLNPLDPNRGQCPNGACFAWSFATTRSNDGYGGGRRVNQISTDHGRVALLPVAADLKTGYLYDFTVYPQIKSIAPTEGGIYGGNTLTIHGSSFCGRLACDEVTVGGSPCNVTLATTSMIKCTVGDRANIMPKPRTLRGLLYRGYAGHKHAGHISDLTTFKILSSLSTDEEYAWKDVIGPLPQNVPDTPPGTGKTSFPETYIREWSGFFVPPFTAVYSFYVAGNDQAEIELGRDDSSTSLRSIAHIPSSVPWSWQSDTLNPAAFWNWDSLDGQAPGQIPYSAMNPSSSSLFSGNALDVKKPLTVSPITVWPGTCMLTHMEASPWFKVSLNGAWIVTSLRLMGRSGCCADQTQGIDIYLDGVQCASSVSVTSGIEMDVPCVGLGSQIEIKHQWQYLAICGFKAFGRKAGTPASCADDYNQWCSCNGLAYYGRKYNPGSAQKTTFTELLTHAYRVKSVAGGISCDTSSMGGDPLPGVDKYCYCVPKVGRCQIKLQSITTGYCYDQPIQQWFNDDEFGGTLGFIASDSQCSARAQSWSWYCGTTAEYRIQQVTDKQRSDFFHLIAGRKYSFRLLHREAQRYGQKTDWLRVAMKVKGLQMATFANGSDLGNHVASNLARSFPAMHLQLLRLRTTTALKREIHFIDVSDTTVSDQAYWLKITNARGMEHLQLLRADYTAAELAYKLQQVSTTVGYNTARLHNCDSVHGTSTGSGNSRRTTIEFRCPLPAGDPYFLTLSMYDPRSVSVTAGSVQQGSAGLGGTFRVGVDNVWSSPINSGECDGSILSRAISSVSRTETTTQTGIELQAWPSLGSWNCREEFYMFVQFRRPLGNLQDLQLDTTGVTGDLTVHKIEIQTLEYGDADAITMDRIPAEYFEMPAPGNSSHLPVRIVTQGILGGSAAVTAPTYVYAPSMTPQLISASPNTVRAGIQMTLELANLIAHVSNRTSLSVWLGTGARCVNITEESLATPNGAHRIYCTVEAGTAGTHKLRFLSDYQGATDPSTAPIITYEATVDSVSPGVGSMAGGTPLTFVGDGLRGLPCSMISIGNVPCLEPADSPYSLLDFAHGDLLCVSPAHNSADACDGDPIPSQASCTTTRMLDITVGAVVKGSFTYSALLTPIANTVSPSSMSSAVSTRLSFIGHGFWGVSTAAPKAPKIRFGQRECKTTEVANLTYSQTQIDCWLPRVAHGQNVSLSSTAKPRIWVAGAGAAIVQQDITSQLVVTSIFPSQGSYVGGTIFSINGNGFSTINASHNVIQLSLPSGTRLPCKLFASSGTLLRCQLESGAPNFARSTRRLLARSDDAHDRVSQPCRGVHSADHVRAQCLAKSIFGVGNLRRHASAAHDSLDVLSALADSPIVPGTFGEPVPFVQPNDESTDNEAMAEEHYRHLLSTKQAYSLDTTLSIKVNGVEAPCPDGCAFSFNDARTHHVLQVTPSIGSFAEGTSVTVIMSGPSVDYTKVNVSFGAHDCPVTSASVVSHNGAAATSLTVPICVFPASNSSVYVSIDPDGYALGASPYSGSDFFFAQKFIVASVSPGSSSFYGGTSITIAGAGFDANAILFVTIDSRPCEITLVTPTTIQCFTPAGHAAGVVKLKVRSGANRTSGLKADIFQFTQGTSLPDLSGRTPSVSKVDDRVFFQQITGNWPGTNFADHFCIRWTGQIYITRAGIYTFETESDAGSVLDIDGYRVVNNDGIHGMQARSGARHLFTGYHTVMLKFFEALGSAGMIWRYTGPDTNHAKVVVPSNVLSHFDGALGPELDFQVMGAAASPAIQSVVEVSGTLDIHGSAFGTQVGKVALGNAVTPSANLQCNPTTWGDTHVNCLLPQPCPAGEWHVRVWNVNHGWSSMSATTVLVSSQVDHVVMNKKAVQTNSVDTWKLVMKISDPDGSTFGYSSSYWTDANTLNPSSPVDAVGNAKYGEFSSESFTRMRICVGGPRKNCVHHAWGVPWSSAQQLFQAGEVQYSSLNKVGFQRVFSPEKSCPCQVADGTSLGGPYINWGNPVVTTLKLELGSGESIIGLLEFDHLKMVKIRIRGVSHDWIATITRTPGTYPLACKSQATFTESCFTGGTVGDAQTYSVSLISSCKAPGQCSRGVFCTHWGAYYEEKDCDGDGIVDPYCSDAWHGTGYVRSSDGCSNTWPSGQCQQGQYTGNPIIPMSPACLNPHQELGFNVECSSGNKARIGWCSFCTGTTCTTDDVTVGVGLHNDHAAPGSGTSDVGAGWKNCCNKTSKDVWIWVESTTVNIADSFHTGFGGGDELELRGSGFGLRAEDTKVGVCGKPCTVTFSNGTHCRCKTPKRTTTELLGMYPSSFPKDMDLSKSAVQFFTERGTSETALARLAFTNTADNPIDYSQTDKWNRPDCAFGFELAQHEQALVYSVAFFPPPDLSRRLKARNTVFEARNLTAGSDWVALASARQSIDTTLTIQQGWNTLVLPQPVYAQKFRIRLLPDICTSFGEIFRGARFYGTILEINDYGTCPVELLGVSSPLSSGPGSGGRVPVNVEYTLARTPILNDLTPNRGTARGGTNVALRGYNLEALDSAGNPLTGSALSTGMCVRFNGYKCTSISASSNEAVCVTEERLNGINAPSTSFWLAGKGEAIIAGNADVTTFRYIDKWSNVYSWQDSEMPVDGDSVYVPQGQSIQLDIDSPLLFLVLVSGWLEFDRKDLEFNATYIWVAGGHFQVGSEASPFLHSAIITLHGDRWNTIEIPFVGSKMLAVTNLGGLQGGCSLTTTGGSSASNPCNVRSVGKLDLHGRPSTSWVRLSETAEAGSVRLKLSEPVQWLPGARVVITSSGQQSEDEEIGLVSRCEDGGMTLVLEFPLQREHLGLFYHHASITPTDLRAAVGLLTKNIKIQGDVGSLELGNSYMFGAHVGAFFGGEMRIENVEFTRTGQAANFGRYSSHWHVLAGARNVDVINKAYLRNNSYHDTFQRAVVVHSTDFAIVKHNVAHRTHGHSFFTEVGDELYTQYLHNLAVHPLPHHLLLDDDSEPAGFWLPGFMGWHRDNMVSNAARGWRLRQLSTAGGATDMTFFNNSVHASGAGWHTKPPAMPPTLTVFKTFIAFRCDMGMFYYGTGNILHDDHRFIECGTGFHHNFLFNGLHTAPFFHNVILVGNINNSATISRVGLGLGGPRRDEYFFTSGLTVINFWDTPVLSQCTETLCTVRYERARFYNSYKRTLILPGSRQSGIYHDLDGTLTGYPNGFVAWKAPFNLISGVCEEQSEHVGGLVCGNSAGTIRMRRLLVTGAEPWQLDMKELHVKTDVGVGTVPFQRLFLNGWAVPVIANYSYDLRVDDPNDFQKIKLGYSDWAYNMEEHGYTYTKVTPIAEGVIVHMNYTDWRDHFNGSSVLPRRCMDREPTLDDNFGSFAIKLWKKQCDMYNFKMPDDIHHIALCNGEYHCSLGLALKEKLDQQPTLPAVPGRLTTVLSSRPQVVATTTTTTAATTTMQVASASCIDVSGTYLDAATSTHKNFVQNAGACDGTNSWGLSYTISQIAMTLTDGTSGTISGSPGYYSIVLSTGLLLTQVSTTTTTPTPLQAGAGKWDHVGAGCCFDAVTVTQALYDQTGIASLHECMDACWTFGDCGYVAYGWAGSTRCVVLSLGFYCPYLNSGPGDCGSSGDDGVRTYKQECRRPFTVLTPRLMQLYCSHASPSIFYFDQRSWNACDPAYTPAVRRALANGMFGGTDGTSRQCGNWCIYDADNPSVTSFFWNPTDFCWNAGASGHWFAAEYAYAKQRRISINTCESGTPPQSIGLHQNFEAQPCPRSGCRSTMPQNTGSYANFRKWSDAAGWPLGRLPRDMENVVIPSDWHVLLDVDTPTLHWVTIDGKLSFAHNLTVTLNAHSIKVWGELEIGTETQPINRSNEATIALYGDLASHTVTMLYGLHLANKVIAVVGKMTAVGEPSISNSTPTWVRLAQTVDAGATEMWVKGEVATWPIGAKVAISPTEYPSPPDTTEAEDVTISGTVYDAGTRRTKITFTPALSYRHFGAVVSTPSDGGHFPQVELAAVVALITKRSNVVLKTGEASSSYGGYVAVVGDWYPRMGRVTFKNVDFERMGKHEYQHPALSFRFLGWGSWYQQHYPSKVENCIFSHSQAGAIEVYNALAVDIIGNTFHKTYRTALWLSSAGHHDWIKVTGNLAIQTLRHPSETTAFHRPFAAFLLEVRPAVFTGNVAAGSTDTGFVVRPTWHRCDSRGNAMLHESDFNEAHGCMVGYYVLTPLATLSADWCVSVKGAKIWKSSHIGITTADQNAGMMIEAAVLADNHIGISLGFSNPNTRGDDHRVFLDNVTFFGSTAASTCSKSTQCRSFGSGSSQAEIVGSACHSVVGSMFRRVGYMAYVVNDLKKTCEPGASCGLRPSNTPVKNCMMPWGKRIGSLGVRYSESHWSRITFGHWSRSDCGLPSVAVTYNPTSKDFTFPHYFRNVKWLSNANSDAKLYLRNFNGADHTDDALQQLAFIDEDGTFGGATSPSLLLPVTNPALAIGSCQTRTEYVYCENNQMRVFKWGAASDPDVRTYGNMKMWRATDGQSTYSKGPLGAECEPGGAPAVRAFQVIPNHDYNLTLFTSPPKNHDVYFYTDDTSHAIRVGLFLTQPFSMEVYMDGALLPEGTYNTLMMTPSRYPTRSDPHGSYAFDPHQRIFYFVMRGGWYNWKRASHGGGHLHLRMSMVVQVALTVSVPLSEFDGTSMIQNLASMLNIDPSRIKIVSVQSTSQIGGRRLQAAVTEVIIQIGEEKQTATMPATSVSGPCDSTIAVGPNETKGNENETSNVSCVTTTTTTIDAFSVDIANSLMRLAGQCRQAIQGGQLAAAIGSAVSINGITVSNPTGVSTATSTTTTTTTETDTLGNLVTQSPPPPSIQTPSSGGGDDNISLIVGIAAAVAFGGLLIAVLIYMWLTYRRNASKLGRNYGNASRAGKVGGDLWFVRRANGVVDGPFGNQQMRIRYENGAISSGTFIRKGDSLGEFISLGQTFPDLHTAFKETADRASNNLSEAEQGQWPAREPSFGSMVVGDARRSSQEGGQELKLDLSGRGRVESGDQRMRVASKEGVTSSSMNFRRSANWFTGSSPNQAFKKLQEAEDAAVHATDSVQSTDMNTGQASALVKLQAVVRGRKTRSSLAANSKGRRKDGKRSKHSNDGSPPHGERNDEGTSHPSHTRVSEVAVDIRESIADDGSRRNHESLRNSGRNLVGAHGDGPYE